MTNRRGFLSFLGAAIATAAYDPERALWVPGAKHFSIPAARVEQTTVELTLPLPLEELGKLLQRGLLAWFNKQDASLIEVYNEMVTRYRLADPGVQWMAQLRSVPAPSFTGPAARSVVPAALRR